MFEDFLMSGLRRTKLILPDGTARAIKPSEPLKTLVKAAQKYTQWPAKSIQIVFDGKEVDMSNLEVRVQDFHKLPTIINVGRKKKHAIKSNNIIPNGDGLNNVAAPSSPRLRGFTGFVPGGKFGFGQPQSRIDSSHLEPEEYIEQDMHRRKLEPTLGYQGCIRGKQHVAGRGWNSTLEHTHNFTFDELIDQPSLPDEIPTSRGAKLEESQVLKLITPPQSPLNM